MTDLAQLSRAIHAEIDFGAELELRRRIALLTGECERLTRERDRAPTGYLLNIANDKLASARAALMRAESELRNLTE